MRRAVLADIHGNLPALEAVVADMAGRRIEAVANLGDCVSGPLWPRETAAFLRAEVWPTVRGNHDRVVGEAQNGGSLSPSDRYAYAALDGAGRAWLRDLPITLELPGTPQIETVQVGSQERGAADVGILAMHARPDDDAAYLLEETWGKRLVRSQPTAIRARLGTIEADLVLTAHSHLQRSLLLPDGPWVLNPGSVGCPAYDDDATDPPHMSEQGSPAARYAVVETRAEGFVFELLSIPYDHAAAARRAAANDRPDWAFALQTGFALRPGQHA